MSRKLLFILMMKSAFLVGERGEVLEDKEERIKREIVKCKEELKECEAIEKEKKFLQLALLHLKDQNQKFAFKIFLEALNTLCSESLKGKTVPDDSSYESALQTYFNWKNTPKENSIQILEKFSSEVAEGALVSYLVAISHANLSQYEQFFDLFFHIYKIYPDHFLAFKTKAILHIRMFDRSNNAQERGYHQQEILKNLALAIDKEPRDLSMYKMFINFSKIKCGVCLNNDESIVQLLNKMLGHNIIIPRSDIQFFVQNAAEIREMKLAQRLIDKAAEWYPSSRLVSIAQQYLDGQFISKE